MFLTGLAGSFGHCLGMCGPLIMLASARYPRQGAASTPWHLLYHTARISVYVVLGALSGWAGGAIDQYTVAAKIPGAVSLFAGLFVIVLGLSYMGWLPFWKRSFESNGWWQRLLKRVVRLPGWKGVVIMGLMNGILPCGLVYEAMFMAGASGSAWVGGLGMLLFGLGTLPTLLVFGVISQMLSVKVRKWLVWAGGVFVILVGVLLVLRGFSGLGLGFSQFTQRSGML